MLIFGESWTNILSSIAGVCGAFFGIIALFQTAKALRAQNLSSDVQTVLTIWQRIDEHWVRLRSVDDNTDAVRFEFGQLVSLYEVACGLFRQGALVTGASETLGEHLRDVLKMINTNEQYSALAEDLKTHPDNYANITWFMSDGYRKVAPEKRNVLDAV